MDLNTYCQNCSKQLPDDRYAEIRIFCSRECFQLDLARHEYEANRNARTGRPCKECEKVIPVSRNLAAEFCSKSCMAKACYRRGAGARLIKARRGRLCKICDGEIPAELNFRTLYCGKSCQAKAQLEATRRFRERQRNIAIRNLAKSSRIDKIKEHKIGSTK